MRAWEVVGKVAVTLLVLWVHWKGYKGMMDDAKKEPALVPWFWFLLWNWYALAAWVVYLCWEVGK